MLFDIEVPRLNGMILNAALALLFYVCGHGFLFESSSIGNPQYAPEVLHQILGHSVYTDHVAFLFLFILLFLF
jgi:hypothetical protein